MDSIDDEISNLASNWTKIRQNPTVTQTTKDLHSLTQTLKGDSAAQKQDMSKPVIPKKKNTSRLFQIELPTTQSSS